MGTLTKNRRPTSAMSFGLVLAILLLGCVASAVPAQTVWLQRFPIHSPPARSYAAMAYDEARQEIVLFGGLAGRIILGDTWVWDGKDWTHRSSSVNPVPRCYHAMVYDSRRQRVVLFGGTVDMSPTQIGDTWEWDGTTWLPRTVSGDPCPAARGGHAMVYDAVRRVTVLFSGGRWVGGQLVPFGDTWEWNGMSWAERFPLQAPPVQSPHAFYYYGPMAFDRLRARSVLFGAAYIRSSVGQDLGDTWEWDGNNWQQMQSGPPRSGHSMAFDEYRGRLVVAGGTVPYQPTPTVERDGTLWLARSATLTVVGASMAYDTRRRRVVLFGGHQALQPLGDTWEYSSTMPASYSPFGSGCAGSSGTPVLSTAPFELPWTGTTFSVDLTALPPAGAVSMYTGFSRTSWGPFSLPLPLGPWGMPGCALSVAAEVPTPVPNQNGTGRFSLAVPLSPALAGLSFYNQALVLDPGANAAGAILSNSGEGQIGMK